MQHNRLKSMLMGAAVAAALTLPADAANNGWVTWPTKTVDAKSVRLNNVVGSVRIDVKASGPVTLNVSGDQERVKGLKVRTDGGTLRIDGSDFSESVWDWKNWFNFDDRDNHGKLFIKIVVPKGENIRIDDLVGNATIGDTYGPLDFDAAVTNATIGRVGPASISLAGSGKISFVQVNGDLKLDIAGSGKITGGNAASVNADIAGSGTAQVGNVSGPLSIDITGSGDFNANRVNGAVDVSIAGAGNVVIGDGVANPLKVDIVGAGDFTFGGLAIDPDIDAVGSGNVKLRAYKGHMNSDGMVNVKIGDNVVLPVPPAPPAPGHAPKAPPAPPAPPKHH